MPFGVVGGGLVCGLVVVGESAWAAASMSSQSMPGDWACTGVPGVPGDIVVWEASAAAVF